MKQNLGSCFWICVILVLTLAKVDHGESALTPQCLDYIRKLIPCEKFLSIGATAPKPSVSCCNGARVLDKFAASSKHNYNTICLCYKHAPNAFPVDTQKSKRLPSFCKLTTTLVLSTNITCHPSVAVYEGQPRIPTP